MVYFLFEQGIGCSVNKFVPGMVVKNWLCWINGICMQSNHQYISKRQEISLTMDVLPGRI